jgi:hypothetical protein
VREDYSPDGSAWTYLPHDHGRSRAYRWGEDGIAGISDNHQRLCLALTLWNGRDPILKERLFGLSGPEGNHGEDVKEYYYYLDNTPTHAYMRMLYKYPESAFPYARLVAENGQRSRTQPEFELYDTGAFDDNRYFDVTIDYAKGASPRRRLQVAPAHSFAGRTTAAARCRDHRTGGSRSKPRICPPHGVVYREPARIQSGRRVYGNAGHRGAPAAGDRLAGPAQARAAEVFEYAVAYEPAESSSGLFGGNSNWRGPIWFPINYLLIETLQKYHYYAGEALTVEEPAGSGNTMSLWDAANAIAHRLIGWCPPNKLRAPRPSGAAKRKASSRLREF